MQPIISPVNFKNSSNVILIVNNDGTLQFFEKITLQLYIPHPLLMQEYEATFFKSLF